MIHRSNASLQNSILKFWTYSWPWPLPKRPWVSVQVIMWFFVRSTSRYSFTPELIWAFGHQAPPSFSWRTLRTNIVNKLFYEDIYLCSTKVLDNQVPTVRYSDEHMQQTSENSRKYPTKWRRIPKINTADFIHNKKASFNINLFRQERTGRKKGTQSPISVRSHKFRRARSENQFDDNLGQKFFAPAQSPAQKWARCAALLPFQMSNCRLSEAKTAASSSFPCKVCAGDPADSRAE